MYQEPKNIKEVAVSYLGQPGSNTFSAGRLYFGQQVKMLAILSVEDIIMSVQSDKSDFGIIPLENSVTGGISESLDFLCRSNLKIVGEIILRIHHCLLVKKSSANGMDIGKLGICYSHPQAFAQCRDFLKMHKNLYPFYTSDTASAANILLQDDRSDSCAVAGKTAAGIYGLKVLSENIESVKNNYTRFAVISKKENPTGNKISLVFSVKHSPGSLIKAIYPFSSRNLNLTKIESRPVFEKPWEYLFFMDFETGSDQLPVEEAIKELKEEVNFVTVLGRYMKGEVREA